MTRLTRYSPRSISEIEVTLLVRDLELIMKQQEEAYQRCRDEEKRSSDFFKEYVKTGCVADWDRAMEESGYERGDELP